MEGNRFLDEGEVEIETDVEYDALVSTMRKVALVHEQIDKINEERISTILRVELDRDLEFKRLYANRSEITNSIPSLWLIVLSTHPVLKSFIKEDDLKAEEDFVEDVKIGYSITFNSSVSSSPTIDKR